MKMTFNLNKLGMKLARKEKVQPSAGGMEGERKDVARKYSRTQILRKNLTVCQQENVIVPKRRKCHNMMCWIRD